MDPYIAQIIWFAGNFAPLQWAFCQGQLLSIAENTALFSLVGTTYGGDGQVTFALPDFRGRIAIGTGQGPGTSNIELGEVGGLPTVTLNSSHMPVHTHAAATTVGATSQNASSEEPAGNIMATLSNNAYAPANTANASLGDVNTTVGVAGNAQPFDKYPPYLGMNYVICVEGIYPSRN